MVTNLVKLNLTGSVLVNSRPTEAKVNHWNSFGHSFAHKVTLKEAFEYDGDERINFEVGEMPLMRVPSELVEAIRKGEAYNWQPSVNDIIDSHKATFRQDVDNTLGIVGKDYGLVQNQKAFEFIDFIKEVSGHEPNIETIGSLGNGERIFITATLGEDSFLNPDDAIKNYLVFSNSHDGSGAVMCFFSPVRIICQNTLNFAIRSCPNKIVFKHTKYVEKRMDWEDYDNRKKALEVFSKSVKFSEEFINRMMALKSENVTAEYVRDFTARMFLDDNKFELYKKADYDLEKVDEISTRLKNLVYSLRDATDFGVGQNFNRGTKVWLLNGLTTMLHNETNWKNGEAEFNSLMFGDGQRKVQRAYDLLIAA